MDFTTMSLLGFFDGDDSEDKKKGGNAMTDFQFKAFIRLCLVLAENNREVKEFNKQMNGQFSWSGQGTYGAFVGMIRTVAETTGDMERVKQILQDILKMEGADRR
ncbi:MAG: hypothetical protein FWC93_01455 [Defluviitaleaceae bacterium]|nr:hypothetical protein [Defluviitaleaceae bacterium]